MDHVVMPPTKQLAHFADEISFGCGVYVKARGNWAWAQQREALRMAWALSNHSLRNTEAVVLLAQTDMVLIPGGWAAARSAVESAARNQWLVEPTDVWDREARWVALMEESGRLATRAEVASEAGLVRRAEQVQSFVVDIKALLPDGVTIPRVPKMKDMFIGPSADQLYAFYTVASQYVHATELSTIQWLSGSDTSGGEERVEPWHWFRPLWGAWKAFRVTALTLVNLQWNQKLPPDAAELDRQMREADRRVDAAKDALLGIPDTAGPG